MVECERSRAEGKSGYDWTVEGGQNWNGEVVGSTQEEIEQKRAEGAKHSLSSSFRRKHTQA